MPTVHVVCGSAGTGKTTYGKRLAARLGAAFLDIDTVTERLARTAMRAAGESEDDRDSPFFKAMLRDPIYETLFDVAAENAGHVPVVLVGPFTRECKDPAWPDRLRARMRCVVEVHFVWCSRETQRRRIGARGNPRDAAKLADWEAFAGVCTDASPPPYPHVYVDTEGGGLTAAPV